MTCIHVPVLSAWIKVHLLHSTTAIASLQVSFATDSNANPTSLSLLLGVVGEIVGRFSETNHGKS